MKSLPIIVPAMEYVFDQWKILVLLRKCIQLKSPLPVLH